MAVTSLYEEICFEENVQYEYLISELYKNKYAIIDDFFTNDQVIGLRQSLLDKYEEERFKKAAIGNHLNELIVKQIRGDQILWIDEAVQNKAETSFFEKITDLISYLNRTCFLGIAFKEFHYAVYPKGTFYKRHIDTFQNDDRRKLSMVCYLNSEDWKAENGGELVLYLDNGIEKEEKVIYPFPGRMVIFESQVIEHEVKPVETERMSITGWLKTR